MTEIATEEVAEKSPAKSRVKRKKAAKQRQKVAEKSPAQPKASEFEGMTKTLCPVACTAERCIISTVNVCKHPHKSGDSGCGPITMRNRERAKHYLKVQALKDEA